MMLIKRTIKPKLPGLDAVLRTFMTNAPTYFIVNGTLRTVGTTSILRAVTNPEFFSDPHFNYTNTDRYETIILADEPIINLQVIQDLYPELIL